MPMTLYFLYDNWIAIVWDRTVCQTINKHVNIASNRCHRFAYNNILNIHCNGRCQCHFLYNCRIAKHQFGIKRIAEQLTNMSMLPPAVLARGVMGKNLKKLKMKKFIILWYLCQGWSNSEKNASHNVKFDARLVLFS